MIEISLQHESGTYEKMYEEKTDDEKIDGENIKEKKIDDFLADLAYVFFRYRVAHRLSQKQLAEKMGISQVMVSKLEKEESNPTIKKLCEMFWDLGLDIKLTISEEDRFNLRQFM